MSEHLLIAVASIIVLGIVAEWTAWRLGLPSILVLLVFGILAGPVTGFLNPDALLGDILFPIVSISVAIILFEGGASLHLSELREVGRVVRNLVTVGAVVAWVLGTAAAYFLLGLELEPALLLGAILVVTGPTVIVPLLRHMRPVPHVAAALKWEGILIDPVGAVLAVLVYQGVIAGGAGAATGVVISGLVKTVVVGGLAAAAAAGLVIWLIDRQWVPEFLESPLALMLVVAAFAGSNVLQPESGLVTATLMGMAVGNQQAIEIEHIIEFKENLRVLLISSLFIILAARLELSDLQGIGTPEVAFVAALMLVVRPATVAVSTIRSELGWRERTLLAWVAPRGIVAAAVASILALELVEHGFAGAERLASVTFLVIIATVAIYGLTATPLARLLGVALPDPQGVLFVGAHRWARAMAAELKAQGIPVRLADTNRRYIARGRLAGLPTYYGSGLTELALDNVDLTGLGHLLAVTSNDEVNSLAALNFREALGGDALFQLPPEELEEGESDRGVVRRRLRGRFLFHPEATFRQLTARFAAGATVKTTELTETFGLEEFHARHPNAVPLFLLDAEGRLTVVTAENPPDALPGQRLVAVVDPVSEARADSA